MINTILFIIMFLFNIIAAFFLQRLSTRFIPTKDNKFLKILSIIPFLINITSISFLGDLNILVPLPIFIVFYQICYKENFLPKIVMALIFYILISSFNMVFDALFTIFDFFFVKNKYNIMTLKSLFWILIAVILLKIIKETNIKISNNFWILLSFLFVGQFTIILAFTNLGIGKIFYLSETYIGEISQNMSNFIDNNLFNLAFLILPFVFLSSIAMIITIIILSKHEELLQRETLESLKENYYENIKSEQKLIRTFRHDMKNHMLTVGSFIRQGNIGKAEKYIDEFVGKEELNTSFFISNNEIVNAVLNNKISIIKENNMEFKYKIDIPKNFPIEDMDMTALLGNALDNAIEANLKNEYKEIVLNLKLNKGLLILQVKNPIEKDIIKSNNIFLTTKKDKLIHGFGLLSMEDIAKKYNGNINTIVENGYFELLIVFPMELKKE